MKKSCIILCFALLTMFSFAQENNLVIAFKSGTISSVKISDVKMLQFNSNLMYLNLLNSNNSVFSIPEIQRMYFEKATSIPMVKNQSALTIYPNPASNQIYIKNLPDSPINLSIYNMSGIEVFNAKINTTTDTFDISALPRGIYVLKTKNQTAKLIKL